MKLLKHFLLAVFIFCQNSWVVAAIPATERAVLTSLYNATNGAAWTNKTNWNGAAGTECTWHGIICDAAQTHVENIGLFGNNLVGTLPALTDLTGLKDFNVYGNQLTGSIPSLSGLGSLSFIDVGNNQLTGSIPALSGLTSLYAFRARNNQLTGALPVPAAAMKTTYGSSEVCGNKLSAGDAATDAAWSLMLGNWQACQQNAQTLAGTGTSVALADYMAPITPGQVSLLENGVTRVWGAPQTQADGMVLYPLLISSASNVYTIYYSVDSTGVLLHKSVMSTGATTTWSPARLVYPVSMKIGEIFETINTVTSVANLGAAPVSQTVKFTTTVVGVDAIPSAQGTIPALKLAQVQLAMLPDGTYPDAFGASKSIVWLTKSVTGTARSVNVNSLGTSLANPVSVIAQSMMNVAGLSASASMTGNAFTPADLSIQFVPGRQKLFSNGTTEVVALPETLPDGTQVFPRLTYGGTSGTTSTVYLSQEATGIKLHKSESSSGLISTLSPAQLLYPANMVIGQTYESTYTQTTVASLNATPTQATVKSRTTIVGVETVQTAMGTFAALKVARQTLYMLPDGSYPAPASLGVTTTWLSSVGGGIVKTEYRDATGVSSALPVSLYAMGEVNVTGLGNVPALSGSTIALADVMGPIVPGRAMLMSDGQFALWGEPTVQADGTRLYSRLVFGPPLSAGGPSTISTNYLSLDTAGYWLHKIDSSSGGVVSTFSPPRLLYPASMTIGQSYETVNVVTYLTNMGANTSTSTSKYRTTVLGLESVQTPMGTLQALKLAQQSLTAMPDGSYPDPATVSASIVWLSLAGGGTVKTDTQFPAGATIASNPVKTLFGLITMTPLGASATNTPLATTLAQGWNLLGNSLNQPLSVVTFFADPTKVTTVWKWDAALSSWQFYTPTMDATTLQTYATSKNYGVLSVINPGEGYWVNAKAAATLTEQTGTAFGLGAADLRQGWNLVATGNDVTPSAFNVSLSATPPTAGTVPINLTSLWAWDSVAAGWYFYAPGLEASNGLAAYITSKNYLDFTAASKTLGKGIGFWVNRP
jgi:hypothetical protein